MFLKLQGQAAATGEGVQNCQGGGRGQYKLSDGNIFL